MRICVVDLGGMSFHLLHARRLNRDEIAPLGTLRLPTGLGARTIHSGYLDAAGWETGLRDIGVLCDEIRSLGPDKVIAVATSAIRSASNAHAFIEAARELHGLAITMLSEEEEAQLSYEGAASDLLGWSGSLAVVDLGGGSCELAAGQGPRYQSSHSTQIGVLSLRDAFDIQDSIGPIKAGAIAQAVRMSIEPATQMFAALRPERVIFASGMARAVHRLARAIFGDSLPLSTMTLRHMRSLRDFVLGWQREDFLTCDVEVARVDVIGIAVIALEAIMSQLSCMTAEFSRRGLREGVALREIAKAKTTGGEQVHLGGARSQRDLLSGEADISL